MVRSHLNYNYKPFNYLSILRDDISEDVLSERLSNVLKLNKGLLFSKGRYALYNSLRRLKLPSGSKIGVQPLNCNTVFDAIKESGYTPMFIDLNSGFNLNIQDLERKIKNISALIITHTFGLPANIKSIKSLVDDKIPIIEDCAHSFLSRYDKVATGGFFGQSIYSFGYAKFPNSLGLGYLIINGDQMQQFYSKSNIVKKNTFKIFLRSILFQFLNSQYIYSTFTQPIKSKLKYSPLAYSEGWDEERTINQNKINYLNAFLNNIDVYRKTQKDNVDLYSHSVGIDYTHGREADIDWNGFMFPLLVKDVDSLMQSAVRMNIPVGRHFVKSIKWINDYDYIDGECPNYERVIKSLVTFPSHYALNSNDVQRISCFLKNKVKIDDNRF